jgi:hypothetical protein
MQRPGVELTVVETYGGSLWRDLRDGRLDALIAPIGQASADLRTLDLGYETWVALVGMNHRLAGIGPLPARGLAGERIAVTGHRDGAALDKQIAELLAGLGVTPELATAGPAPLAAVAAGEMVALTTTEEALPAGVIARTLDPRCTLAFELLWRDESPSPALTELIGLADAHARRAPARRRLAAVA